MKAREPRKKALLAARVRSGASWRDVCLLNLSSRGALVQATNPPPKGAYIEVRRGSHVIVARVVWTEKHRFGIHSQDAIAVDDIMSERDSATPQKSCHQQHVQVDRRRAARNRTTGERHEQSRFIARSAEFFCLTAAVVFVASWAFSLIQGTLVWPMTQIEAQLASR